MADGTTIYIQKKVRDALHKVKKYPRETYDETLERMVEAELKRNLKKKMRM